MLYYDRFIYFDLIHCIVYGIQQPPFIAVIGPSYFSFTDVVSILDIVFTKLNDHIEIAQDCVKFQLKKCDLSSFMQYNFNNHNTISLIMKAFYDVKSNKKLTNKQLKQLQQVIG